MSDDKLWAQKIVRVVREYLGFEKVTNIVEEFLGKEAISEPNTSKYLLPGLKIMIQAARNCLKRMSLHYHTVSKNVYIDGNEKKDVVKYC